MANALAAVFGRDHQSNHAAIGWTVQKIRAMQQHNPYYLLLPHRYQYLVTGGSKGIQSLLQLLLFGRIPEFRY
ncbi:hypothetical protein AM218_10045 [Hymenobacter sp. DG25A]|nr:hypothetical protein AM218_10045 [Hymenobacter sp. DG25A]